jgi:antitoxin (DNA-binding transcriptional repressor) of toxin-antitoxin stability system
MLQTTQLTVPCSIILGVKKIVIRLSTEEASATSLASLLARVSAGNEFVIESGQRPIAVLRAAEPIRRRISECIALLPEQSAATIDPDYLEDVNAAVESQRLSLRPPAWD